MNYLRISFRTEAKFLLKIIDDLSTIESDIILDFHLGSGTSSSSKQNESTIHRNRQMDYIETVA
jgi:adenine specific DNA methylase Mod